MKLIGFLLALVSSFMNCFSQEHAPLCHFDYSISVNSGELDPGVPGDVDPPWGQ